MKQYNLDPFYSVHECSGGSHHIFRTQEEAEAAIEKWNDELDQQLEKWLAGDRSVSDSLIESTLESDLEGGCYHSYHIHTAWRPSGWTKLEIGQVTLNNWEDAVGADKISWGNPATARPQKPSRV